MANWDERFMKLALHISEWSKYNGRHIGAVIVGPDDEIRSTGYDGFPRGIRDDVPERTDRATNERFYWVCCAERNAIYNAARIGVALKGCRLYVHWHPCTECAKAIIQSGITEVIGVKPDYDDPKWGGEFKRAGTRLEEAGVKLRLIPLPGT